MYNNIYEILYKREVKMDRNTSEQSELIGREEVAKMLKCNLVTIWRYMRDDKLPYYRVGRKILFRKDEILESIKIK